MRNPLKTSTQHKDCQSTRWSGQHSAETCVTQHIVHGRGGTVHASRGRSFQERLCEGFGWHNPTFLANGGATPQEYCLFRQREHIGPWQWRGCTGTWPPQKDDQAGPAVLSGQFRVSSGLPRSGNVQGLAIDRGCPSTSSAFASNWGDHGRDRF